MNPYSSSQRGVWHETAAFSFGKLIPDDRGWRLWFFVVCSIVVLGASYATNPGFNGLVHFLLLLSLMAVSYFSREQSSGQISHCDLTLSQAAPVIRRQRLPDEQEHLFRSVFDNAAGMALVAPSGKWITVNRALCSVLGYCEEELLAQSLHDIAYPDDIGATLVHIEKVIEGRLKSHQTELRFTHKLGHLVWMVLNISTIPDHTGSASHLVFQFQDITDRKMEEERLVHSVFHDALTGLPNRALFMDRLRLATERWRRRKDQLFAVLFVDLDCFKTINDSMGHIMGDQVLIQVSRRLKTCLRTTDTIARLGGDEFTILLEDLGNEHESIRVVERLQNALSQPFKVGAGEIVVTASIGVRSSITSYDNAEEILRDADMAMYGAKSSGKSCYHVYTREQHTPELDTSILSNDLEKAVERGQLLLNYQPIVCLETGKLSALEALVRWQHPRLGLISPCDFIPLAEEQGSIVTVGNWVLRDACQQLKDWQQKFPFQASLAVTVNLSGKQFMQPDFIDEVIGILQDTQLDPRSLKLEITETVLMENIETVTAALQQLRALGIELSVDDFGTGYSSLSYLHSLPINSLKIDRSFVSGMVERRDHAEIVKTILNLARSLGIRVVAEGVETLEQLVALRELQCEAGQGFLFSKPADVETMETVFGKRNQWQVLISSLERNEFRPRAMGAMRNTVGATHGRRPLLRAV